MSQTLSNTLAKIRKQGRSVLQCSQVDSNVDLLDTVYDTINHILHKESDRYLVQEDAEKLYDVSNFSVDSFISEINPVLWDFIKSITRGKGSTEMTNEKRLACVYCLCVLLFVQT